MFITNLRSPVVSILDAVLTVSPNKQYLGILDPTTPPTTGPVWIPIRCCSVSNVLHKICTQCWVHVKWWIIWLDLELGYLQYYLWGMMNLEDPSKRSNAILAISSACLSPFRIGNPLATMYESFIVSTCKEDTKQCFTANQQTKYADSNM